MKGANHLKEREEKMRMALGDYTMAIAGMKALVAGKKVAMAKVCVTMKALYGMASTGKLKGGLGGGEDGGAPERESVKTLQTKLCRKNWAWCL